MHPVEQRLLNPFWLMILGELYTYTYYPIYTRWYSETIHGPAKCKVDTLVFSSVAMPRLLGLSCFR